MFKRLGHLTLDTAWGAVILLLPITSFPLLSQLAGGTMVAPASFIPLIWLIIFWFIYYLIKKGKVPYESVPLLFFISVALVSCAFAYFLDTPPYRNGNILHEEIDAFLSLLIGVAFYLVTASWLSQSQSRVVITLRLVNVSGAIMLLWSIVQAIYIFLFDSAYPTALMEFQRLVSTRDLFIGRITAFAFEPSWLAQQLNLIYLPFWLAATISGWSAYHLRLWKKISPENIFLVVGAIVLFLSSRIGTLSFLFTIAFLSIYFNIYAAQRLQKRTLEHFTRFPLIIQKILRKSIPVFLVFVFLGTYLLVTVALIYILSGVDWRFARFFQLTSWTQFKLLASDVYLLFNYLAFAERFVYWVAGWNIFNAHPLLGVGLGNAGFYFQQALPAYSWSLPEVMDTYFRISTLPNIKSLWIRLLAETGIVGLSSFLAWCYVMVRTAWSMRRSNIVFTKTIGWYGLFVLVAFVIEGFSTDTFALPYLWVSLGILCAVGAIMRESKESR